MKLNDRLVDSFEHEGELFKLELSFDNVLDALDVLNDNGLLIVNRFSLACEMLTGVDFFEREAYDVFTLWGELSKRFIYPEAEQAVIRDRQGNVMPSKVNEKHMDISQDADFIFSSFLQAYGVDLFEQQGKLHWNKFKSLLNGLPQDTKMQQVIQIRMWTPPKGCDEKERNNMFKLQEQYALRKEEENE